MARSTDWNTRPVYQHGSPQMLIVSIVVKPLLSMTTMLFPLGGFLFVLSNCEPERPRCGLPVSSTCWLLSKLLISTRLA